MLSPKIVVVEDEGIVAADLQDRLEALGYSVPTTISSAEEAIVKIPQINPDLVLMDIILKGEMDGIQAADVLRREHDLPVVFLTSHSDQNTLNRARVTEPFGYIVKPFEERELHATIEMAFYRHKAERKLRKMERWLTTTLRSIGDAVIATDKMERITMMNPVAEALTGWRQLEALGRSFTDVFKVVHEITREPIQCPVKRALAEGMVINLEENAVLIGKDGQEVPVDDSAAPIRDDEGEIIGCVVVFRDSTYRKSAEAKLKQELSHQFEERMRQQTARLEEANKELEAFTYSVSHDLRSPISAIDGFAQALSEDYENTLDPEGKQFLGIIRKNAQRMGKMVEDFLRLSRLGHKPLELKTVKTAEMVKEIVVDLTQHPGRKGAEIKIGALPNVQGDESLLSQVWTNLLSNALKFSSHRKKPLVEISATEDKDDIVFSVKDNGAGFDMKHADRLFGVFQRFHSPEEFDGTGLGLAIARRIILRHGGRIWAESQRDKGAQFFFALPKTQ